jgi:hypothetical protein
MNRSKCEKCKEWVPARRVERDGKLYLVKDCPTCGPTEAYISVSASRSQIKRELDPGFKAHEDCCANCLECTQHRTPTYAFVDVTNRCNLNCPMCADSVPGHGFVFEPPIEHLEKVLEHLAQFEPKPTIALFGGEPTVRRDVLDIVKLSAKKYGFKTRVLTNGLKLADEAFTRELLDAKAHLLISYDGANPKTYHELRNSAKALELKKKGIENVRKVRRAKISYVHCLAWGLNDKALPEFLEFLHPQRDILHGVYLMPLVQTWDTSDFAYQPQRMTTEDVEMLLAGCFPGYKVEFVSLGLASEFNTLMKYLHQEALPWRGCHPNCESFYALVSDGTRYWPIEHYLKHGFPALGQAMLGAERKLAAREERWKTSAIGRFFGALRLRNFLLRARAFPTLAGVLFRHVRLGRLFKGRGPMKLLHALAYPFDLAFARKAYRAKRRHLNVDTALPVVILPLEDDSIIETERLSRCPCVHVYYDPRLDAVNYVPVCSWRLHNKKILGELAKYYAERRAAASPQPEPAPSTTGTA